MATILRIKRSETAGNPATLAAGELAYSGLTFNGSNGGDRLYIGMGVETDGNAANHLVIGGKYFTDLLDHSLGTVTASSALLVDSNKKLNELLVDNITIDGNSITTTDENGNLTLEPNGSGKVYLTTDTVRIGDAGVAASLTTNGAGSLTLNTNGGTDSGSISIAAGAAGNITIAPNGQGKTIIGNLHIDANTSIAEYIYDTIGGQITAGTGITVTNNDGADTSTIAITNTTVTAGTYGSASKVPSFTVNGQGQLTAASEVDIATNLTITADTGGTETISLLSETLDFEGGTGIATAVSANKVTISIGQSVGTTSDVTFNNLTLSGNLTVNGTTTTINSTVTSLDDPIITLGGDTSTTETVKDRGVESKWGGVAVSPTSYAANGTVTVTGNIASTTGWAIGDVITITGAVGTEQEKLNGTWKITALTATSFAFSISSALATGTYTTDLGSAVKSKIAFFGLDQSTGRFVFIPQADNTSETFSGTVGDIEATTFHGNATSASKWATPRDLSLTGDATTTLTGVDGAANATATITLSTVNSNVGTYGSSTQVPSVTVNAKGLVTAISTNNIPTATASVLGLASFSNTYFTVTSGDVAINDATTTTKGIASFSADNFTVTSGAVTINVVNGGTY